MLTKTKTNKRHRPCSDVIKTEERKRRERANVVALCVERFVWSKFEKIFVHHENGKENGIKMLKKSFFIHQKWKETRTEEAKKIYMRIVNRETQRQQIIKQQAKQKTIHCSCARIPSSCHSMSASPTNTQLKKI